MTTFKKYLQVRLHGECQMNFDQWKFELAAELGRTFDMDGATYIKQTGEECWREMFDDGLSPIGAAGEEAYAAACSI